jgi:ribosomal protein S18 acetylase RimI-like enzyme
MKPVKGNYFIKWLHAGLYKEAEILESHSCENFLKKSDIKHLMCKKYGMGGFVITEINKPIGYTIYEQSNSVLEIVNLVVHQDYRRRGIGTLLLERLETRKKWDSMQLTVRESNLDTHLFLQKLGFISDDVKKYYFEDHFLNGTKIEDGFHFIKIKEKNNDR